MSYIMECCTYFKEFLPRAELSFIPALVMGTFFSSLLIIELYKKQSHRTLLEAIKDVFYMVFFSYPDNGHFEFRKCITNGCLKCKEELDIKYQIGKKYDALDNRKMSIRIQNAISVMSSNYETTAESHNRKNEQCPSVFKMNLASNAWWTEYDVYQKEKELLKLNFDIVLREYNKIYKLFEIGKTDGWKLNLTPNGHWCIFPLLNKGVFNEFNLKKCPNTAELLRNFPLIMKDCVFGNAFYSLLYPESVISPHHGPTNIRLRCNLGLDVPQRDCWLKIGGEKHSWKTGGFTVYDDSFQHSFYSAPKKQLHKPVATLVFDFWHPDISEKEIHALKDILPPF